jgi:hypothetical protein
MYMGFVIWNVNSLCRSGSVKTELRELAKYEEVRRDKYGSNNIIETPS